MRVLVLAAAAAIVMGACGGATKTPTDFSTPDDLTAPPTPDLASPDDLAIDDTPVATALAFKGAAPSCASATILPTLVVGVVDAKGNAFKLSTGTITLTLQSTNGAALLVFGSNTAPSGTPNAAGQVKLDQTYITQPGDFTITATYSGSTALNPASLPISCHSAWTATATQPTGAIKFQALLVAPTDSHTIYAGTDAGLFKSTDTGATWTEQKPGGSSLKSVNQIVTDASNRIYVSSGGISDFYRQAAADTSWTMLTGPGSLIAFPAAGNEIYTYGGAAKQWAWSNNDGSTWTTATYGPATYDTLQWLLDPTSSGASAILYVASYQLLGTSASFNVSVDRGQNWNPISPCATGNFYAAVGTDGTLFSRCGLTVQRSTDHGTTWSTSSWGPGLSNSTPTTFAFHPSNHSIVYGWSPGSGVLRSADGGATIGSAGFLTYNPNQPTGIAVDPTDPNIVWLGVYSQGIFKTTTGGL